MRQHEVREVKKKNMKKIKNACACDNCDMFGKKVKQFENTVGG